MAVRSRAPRSASAALACLLLVTACVATSNEAPSSTSAGPTLAPRATQAPSIADVCGLADAFCINTAHLERGSVVKIVDGDTLDVTIDGRPERVRIFGIDTAERGDRCFAEASDRLRALAADDVRLAPDARDRDRSGRLLRYVYTREGTSIDAIMVAEGLARAWTRDGALRDPLVSLEALARAERRGCLWGG
jgi:micrococcal nuclease